MSARVLWKGLAVVDVEGRVVTWRGSETPKLFHSEEQVRHHCPEGTVFAEAELVLPTPATHEEQSDYRVHRPPIVARTTGAGAILPAKRYQPKRCEHCRKTFTPDGPHSKYCGECRA